MSSFKHIKHSAIFSLFIALVSVYSAAVAMRANPWGRGYMGLQGGKAWTHFNWEYKNANYFNTFGSTLLGTNFHQDTNGLIGGGNLGYNYQVGSFLVGFNGAYQGTDINTTIDNPFFITDRVTSNLRSIASFTGRLGYAYGDFMAYLGGGYAGGNTRFKVADAGSMIDAAASQWANGWTLGAGGEYLVVNDTSIGLAYDYTRLKLNNRTVSCPNCGAGIGLGTPVVDGTINTQSVMLKLNYYFDV